MSQAPKKASKGGMKRKEKDNDDSHKHKKKKAIWISPYQMRIEKSSQESFSKDKEDP